MLTPLFFNTTTDVSEPDSSIIKLNNTELIVSKMSSMIYMCVIMPLMIWFFYAFKTEIKNKLPHFINHILVIIFIIIYSMCSGGIGLLIYKLFNTNTIITTPTAIPTATPTATLAPTTTLASPFADIATSTSASTSTTTPATTLTPTTKIVSNGMVVNTLELTILRGSSIVYLSVVMPVLIYCFYLLRKSLSPVW